MRIGCLQHAASVAPAFGIVLAALVGTVAADSTCHGTPANGWLEEACRLPASGENFVPYSWLLRLAGRTFAHCRVARTVEDAYAALAVELPGRVFVYGESGKRRGGPFPPHKTHRNGLSVDFMVPVRDADARSVALPTNAFNRYGYSIDFTLDGRHEGLTIDYEAFAAHLAALREAAETRGIGIRRVLFDPEMQPALRETAAWPRIASLTFSTRRSWVRHDDHYHVDFDLPCEPL